MSGPATPDDLPLALRCANGHVLGMRVGPVCIVKHDRRVYAGVLFFALCKCGSAWQAPELRHQIANALDGLPRAMDVADLPDLPELPEDAQTARDK